MLYRRGDVIAVPYDYSDLTGGKVRPAVVVSSDDYNLARPDIVAAGVSTQVRKGNVYDYILVDWAAARLRYPSLVRGRLLTLEQSLIRRTVGRLSAIDLSGLEAKLLTFLLSDRAIVNYVVSEIDLRVMPGPMVQMLAEKTVQSCLALTQNPTIDIKRLRALLSPQE